MRKQHYKFTIGIVILISLCCFQLKAQKQPIPVSHSNTSFTEEFLNNARGLFDWPTIQTEFSKQMKIDAESTTSFFVDYLHREKNATYFQYCHDYFEKVKDGTITATNATQYWLDLLPSLEDIYTNKENTFKKGLKPADQNFSPSFASCNNLDFSAGTTSWTGRWNNNANSNNYNTQPASLPTNGLNSSGTNNTDYVHELVTAGNDPYAGISRVPPGHSSALRLGDDEAYNLDPPAILPFNHQMIRNTFTVSSANPTITYWYAVVFTQEKSTLNAHTQGDQPYFKIKMFDKNGNEIKCASYDVDISGGISAGFTVKDIPFTTGSQEQVIYKDWQPIFIPLIDYVGQQVTIQFES